MKKFFRYLAIGLVVLIGIPLLLACIVYPPEYVYRVLVWQDSDAFDWQKFPSHSLSAAPTAYHFNSTQDPRVEELFQQLSGTENWNSFLETRGTQSFIVFQDGTILYENYFNNTQRDSIVTPFSVA